jgi:hypothetical protein
MRLSESETRLVKKWEGQERAWRWQRWVWLGMCSLLLAVFTLVFRWFVMAEDEEHAARFIAVWNPAVWMIIVVSCYRLVDTLCHWRGHAKTKLLLRLIAEHEKDGA